MNLAEINAVLRPRRTLEAVDLGMALVRRFSKRVFGAWMLTVLPLWTLFAVLLWDYPGVAILLIWFTKPLVDRVPLYVISRGLFGEVPPVKEVVRAFPKMLVRNFFALTVRHRLSMCGALLLPVVDLEGGQNKEMRKDRIKAITRVGSGVTSVMWVFSLIEASLLLGLLFIGQMLIPESLVEDATMGLQLLYEYADPSMITPLIQIVLVAYIVVVSLVEPFYVGGGFGVYVNVRSIMEGWDIELEFRKLGARIQEQTAPSGLQSKAQSLVALVAACLFAVAFSPRVMAESDSVVVIDAETEVVEDEWTAADSRAVAAEVLEQDAFDVKTQKVWKPAEKKEGPKWNFDASPLLVVAQVLFWGVVIAVVGWLIWVLIGAASGWNRKPSLKEAPDERPRVDSFLGMNLKAESLPDDLVNEARKLWNEQRFVEAMGLLYRGAIGWMVDQGHIAIEEGDTEGDAMRRVNKALGEVPHAVYFRHLTEGWMATVYASFPPSSDRFEEWCQQWPYRGDAVPGEGGAQ